MLTDSELKALPSALQGHFIKLEHDIVETIAQHIGDIGRLSATDVHRLDQLQKLGFNMESIQAEIAKTVETSEQEILDLFIKASETEYGGMKEVFDLTGTKWIPFDENERLIDLVHRISRATFMDFQNIADARMIGFIAADGRHLPLYDFYQRSVDYAITQVESGQIDFYGAMRSVVRPMSERGLTYVEWESGYRRRVDSTVRQNLLGGLQDLSRQQAEMLGAEIGADGMEISWHSGHRPSHWFGGMQFTLEGYERDIKPLMEEPNCYHRAFPIVMGISIPAYTDEQLEELRENEVKPRYFEGKAYTQYKAEQKQRRYETSIRKQKDLINGFTALGDEESAKSAKIRLRQLQGSYRDFSGAVQLSTKPLRTRVPIPA